MWVYGTVLVAVFTGNPAEVAAGGGLYRHAAAALGGHLPERGLLLDRDQCGEQLIQPGIGEAGQYEGLGAHGHPLPWLRLVKQVQRAHNASAQVDHCPADHAASQYGVNAFGQLFECHFLFEF